MSCQYTEETLSIEEKSIQWLYASITAVCVILVFVFAAIMFLSKHDEKMESIRQEMSVITDISFDEPLSGS